MKMKDKVNYYVQDIENMLDNFKFSECHECNLSTLSLIEGKVTMLYQLDLISEDTFYHLINIINAGVRASTVLYAE